MIRYLAPDISASVVASAPDPAPVAATEAAPAPLALPPEFREAVEPRGSPPVDPPAPVAPTFTETLLECGPTEDLGLLSAESVALAPLPPEPPPEAGALFPEDAEAPPESEAADSPSLFCVFYARVR